MLRKKLLIINKGVEKTGKSTAVKEVIRLLEDVYKLQKDLVYPETDNFEKTDMAIVFTLNGVNIGIESCGDPSSRLPDTLRAFYERKCEIIFCACRTKGEMKDAICDMKNDGYVLLYAPHYFDEEKFDCTFVKSLNARYARNIVEIMLEWIAKHRE